MSEHEKKRQRIYHLLNTEAKPPKFENNPLDFALSGVLGNKTNATSPRNIGSLRIAIQEEWNKMFEEFILKASKSFRRHVDTIIEKKNGHIE